MTLSDDLVIRELTDLAERAVPPMGLTAAAVVGAGRRRRRRVAGARVALVAGLGVTAAGIVLPALDPPETTTPVAATATLAPGLVASAVNTAEVVPSGYGEMLALADGEGGRYTARFDAAEGWVLLGEGTQAVAADEGIAGFWTSDAADQGEGINQSSSIVGDAIVVAGYVVGPGDVHLEWSVQGGTGSLELPTFAVPGAAGRVYLVRIHGTAPEGSRPLAAVVYEGTVQHRADVDLTTLRDLAAPTVELAPGVVAVQAPVPAALDDGSTGVDLGVRTSTVPGAAWTLALRPLTDAELAEALAAGDAVEGADGGVWITAVGAPDADGLPLPWTWSSASSPAADDVRWDTVLRYGGADDDSRILLGAVPPWLTSPRVVVFSRDGFVLADGSRVPTLEVPVYPAPTNDGRLLYTVAMLAPADGVDGFEIDVDATFAIGSDGSVVAGQRCAGLSLEECAALLGPDVHKAVRTE